MTRSARLALERIRSLIRGHAAERDVADEIAFHVAMETTRLIARGLTPDDARAAALSRFGDVSRVRGEMESVANDLEDRTRRADLIEELRQDVSFAFRQLRRTPAFSTIALLTIAIGIGSATAMFSVVDAVLLQALPYPTASRLVVIANGTGLAKSERTAVAAPEFADIVEQTKSLDGVAAIRDRMTAVGGECTGGRTCDAVQVSHLDVSPEFFNLLGVRPEHGRLFAKSDGSADAALTVVLSHSFWERRFGGDTSILGRTIDVGGQPRTVVGILPSDVRFPEAPVAHLARQPDIWTPTSWERFRTGSRGNQILAVIGRMRSDASIQSVRADLGAIAARFRAEYPDRYTKDAKWRIVAVPMLDEMIGDARPILLTLFAAVGVILLMACGNLTNLLIARGAARGRELALRTAIGAQRGRIARQLITESVVLVLSGGLLGVLGAYVAVPALTHLDPGSIPRFETATVNLPVLLFAAVVSLICGVGVGLIPALRLSRVDINASMKPGTALIPGGSFMRLRSALVMGEIGLAVIVLVISGLLIRTVSAIDKVPLGLSGANVLTFQVSPPRARFDSAYKLLALHDRLLQSVRSTPGVTVASAVYPLPMSNDGWSGSFNVEGDLTAATAEPPHAEYSVALPDYFKTMSIRMIAGRDFNTSDGPNSDRVVIVDQALAARQWPGQSAIGRRISTNSATGPWETVIGVVDHVRRAGPLAESEPQIYLPLSQNPQGMMYYVAEGKRIAAATGTVQHNAASVDAGVPIAKLGPMSAVIASAVARQRFNTLLFMLFGGAAIALSAFGLYGVMAYLVGQRRQEIGIRLALGDTSAGVLRAMLREGMTVACGGVILGVVGAAMATKLVSSLLFGVGRLDVPTFIAITVLLLGVSASAIYRPARSAALTNPVDAMRG